MPASEKYYKGKAYKSLWGEHYRKVWHTPVAFNVVSLDTLAGGLTPYEMGGSRQTKSIKLRDRDQREYVLRSIDKTFSGALPEIAQGGIIESMANDQVTISNPYGALVVAPLAEAAGILHTNPQLMYIPRQPALGKFNNEAGNTLYLFERRPDENWETANEFANSKKIIGTDKLLEKVKEDNDNQVDQPLFLRSRLFDMLIGDWGRHEDQWRWAAIEEGKKTIYKPVPRDRDNAFTRFDGFLLSKFTPAHLQSFGDNLEDVNAFGFTARGLDRRFTSELTLEQWTAIAKDMQAKLTDSIIIAAVRSMPPEVLPLLEAEYISKLTSRRNNLESWAIQYYNFINKDGVDVVGSEKKEQYEVKKLNEQETEVTVYKITKEGEVKEDPLYHRIFKKEETKEIRVFGLGDKDIYDVNEETPVLVDSAKSGYPYKYFKYNKSGFKPILYYNRDDRIHTGLAYKWVKHKWNKDPFWQEHSLAAKYSLSQQAFSFTYLGTFTRALGKWDINLLASYDFVRWLNFYGLGNESPFLEADNDFFRFRHKELYFEPSLERVYKNRQRIKIAPFVQYYMPIVDTSRFIYKAPFYNTSVNYENKLFAGLNAEYVYQRLNDSTLPTKGFGIIFRTSYTHPLTNKDKDGFVRLGTDAKLYIPLTHAFNLAIKSGISTLVGGVPEFYQYNVVGGTRTVRGYRRSRFQGTSAFYNQNELYWIKDVRSYLYNGRVGLFALYDLGRVWQEDEISHKLHTGYGGGFLINPFNKFTLAVSYAFSVEGRGLNLNLVRPF